MLAPERAQLSASHETPMNKPRTINQEYWLPANSFIMAGATGELRKTASKPANARMARAKCMYVLRIKRLRSVAPASAAAR